MFSIEKRISELVAMGVPRDVAGRIAAKDVADHQAEVARIQAEERAKALSAVGAQEFLGFRISGYQPAKYAIPTHRGCQCLEDGIAVQPASLGADSKTGGTTLYPPKLWIFRVGHQPSWLNQSDCEGLLQSMDKLGDAQFRAILESIGSAAAVAEYQSARAKAVKTKAITSK